MAEVTAEQIITEALADDADAHYLIAQARRLLSTEDETAMQAMLDRIDVMSSDDRALTVLQMALAYAAVRPIPSERDGKVDWAEAGCGAHDAWHKCPYAG